MAICFPVSLFPCLSLTMALTSNGDGLIDLAILFLPVFEMTASNNLNVSKLWQYPGNVTSAGFHKSLAIFHGSESEWLSGNTQVYVLLDDTGALETPSFKLLVSHVGDKDYKDNVLPDYV